MKVGLGAATETPVLIGLYIVVDGMFSSTDPREADS
jgi:hypothetical protein